MIPVIVAILMIGFLLLLLVLQRRSASLKQFGRRLFVVYGVIVIGLIIGEVYFRYFYADSQGRLALENWMERYWQENSLGYRDPEWTESDWDGKIKIAIVGDSYAAGWGIEDPDDRFGDVFASMLGEDFAVFNLAQVGGHTAQELANLEAHPAAPFDAVILQYFLDDIDYTLLRMGLPVPTFQLPPLVRESHLANFIYFRFNGGFGEDFWRDHYAAYDNFAIWEEHRAELETFIDYVEEIDADLYVVIFPNMQDPVASIPYVDRVAHVFEERGYGYGVIKLFDAVAAWEATTGNSPFLSEREAHPTNEFHHYIGGLLYEQFLSHLDPP